MPSTVNAYPKSRNRAITLRDSFEEGHVQLQEETVRLRTIPSQAPMERDTERDTSNGNKRRRGSYSYKDELIGVTIPRKARSVSVKRPHHSWVSASGGGAEERNFRRSSSSPGRESAGALSPSSSNASVRNKMKAIGPNTGLPQASNSSSSAQEDIEFEIAELLYGLRTSKHQDSSQKLEPSSIRNHQTSVPPRSSSPSSLPSTVVEQKKVGDYSPSSKAPNNSTAESVRIENEQLAKVEILAVAPESAKISSCHDDDATGHVTGSSNCPKENTDKENLNSDAGLGVSEDGRSISFAGESPSCPKSNVDKEDLASNKAISAVLEAISQRVDKFEIDLMASPPLMPSPERDDLSRGDLTSKTKALALDLEMKKEDSLKVENTVEKLVMKEETREEIVEVKMEEKRDIITNNKLEDQDRKMEQPTDLTKPKVETTVQSGSVPWTTGVQGRPSSISPLGYMPPMQTMAKIDKTIGSLASQQVDFVLSQPQPKRCATHHFIARNIFLHKQLTKMNPFLPATIASSSLCGTKLSNVNCMLPAERLVVGKQSLKQSGTVNQNAAQDKGRASAGDPSQTAIKSSGTANSMNSIPKKRLVLQQGPHLGSTGNLVHGSTFPCPPSQHKASVTTASTQPGVMKSRSNASSASKSRSSSVGSFSTSSTVPAVAAAMSFSYPNLAANDPPYVTMVQNNGYLFPFSTPFGATAAIKGASHAQATPILSGPFYPSQMLHAVQHPEQNPHSQALVQPINHNASTSTGSSSSHKQPQCMQVNGKKTLTSSTMQLEQSLKQHTPLSHCRRLEIEMGKENSSSVANQTSYSQNNVFGQNYAVPVQPLNFSFRPSATLDSVGGNSGNFVDKQQQQLGLKGGVELIPSQEVAISFAGFNGTSIPSNLNFSSFSQNPVIIQSLPDVSWQGYQAASGGSSSHHDDEKKATSGKPSNNGPTTLVFDNSSKNLNFGFYPMNGNRPNNNCSIASDATSTSVALSTNASNSQQLLQLPHLQKHAMQQQQPAMAPRYKESSINTTAATKFVNNPPIFSQTQSISSNQASQSNNLGRIPDSLAHNTPLKTSTTSTIRSFSQEQGRILPGHMQISFGGNYISPLPPQGQQLLNNIQPLCTTVAGTPPHGHCLKAKSQENKVGSSMNTVQMSQTENSSAGTGQKSSPVCRRNVPSILSSCPSQLSELKY